MKDLPTIDLSRIREHAGAKDRGFEEFAYLLAWDLEGLDQGTEIERRSTPDGGIEFSCIPVGQGNGGRWAWQAKYLFKFDKSTFAQMTKSVISALDNTQDLERYIFVFPKDRSDVGLGKWKVAVAAWTEEAAARGMRVEFQFRGESQLVTAATSDTHAGAIRYFFDEQFLTQEFMAAQIAREVKNLGERYSPEVNVETEARSIIDAACRGPRFTTALRNLLGGPAGRRPFVDSAGQGGKVVVDGAARIATLLDEWNLVAVSCLERLGEPGDAVFGSLEHHGRRLREGIEAEQATVTNRIAELTQESRSQAARRKPVNPSPARARRKSSAQKAEDVRESQREILYSFGSSLWRLRSAVDEVLWYLESSDVKAATSGSLSVRVT